MRFSEGWGVTLYSLENSTRLHRIIPKDINILILFYLKLLAKNVKFSHALMLDSNQTGLCSE
jgi:hypothetical protein